MNVSAAPTYLIQNDIFDTRVAFISDLEIAVGHLGIFNKMFINCVVLVQRIRITTQKLALNKLVGNYQAGRSIKHCRTFGKGFVSGLFVLISLYFRCQKTASRLYLTGSISSGGSEKRKRRVLILVGTTTSSQHTDYALWV